MVPVKNKAYFLSKLLDKKYLLKHSIENFLSELLSTKDKLDKIDFFDRNIEEASIENTLYIYMRKNIVELHTKGEKYRGLDPLFYFLFCLSCWEKGSVAICFIGLYDGLESEINDAFYEHFLAYNEIYNAWINYITIEVRLKRIYLEIDNALKNRDEKEFMRLSSLYNHMKKKFSIEDIKK